jgi:glycosyltransferase involved in cell wall biosynthesis
MPHVSVVIPVFNAAALVASALRSVFAQTFLDYEVILVDDGSEDREALTAALAEFSGRVQCIRQPNAGPARARNTGIAAATGELVAFLDADDEWLPEKLARQVEYFARYPETGLLHTAVVHGTRHAGTSDGPPRSAFCELYHTDFFINTLTVMMPRRVLQELGGFDERREIHVEDWDLWLRTAARHPLGYISTPLALHRRGGLMSRQIDRTYEAQLLVMAKSQTLCSEACARRRADPIRCERRRRHVLHRDWGHNRFEDGDRRGARAQFRRALAEAPFDSATLRLYASTFVGERWRDRVRRLLRRPQALNASAMSVGSQPPDASTPNARQRRPADLATPLSLVHDTTYRRLRQHAIRRVHTLEDTVARMTQRRKRVLFEAASPMSLTIFMPLYERLARDPRVELWFTSCATAWEPHQIFGGFGITNNVLSRDAARWFKSDAYINSDFWDMTWLHRHTRRIHLFHGVAGKYNLDAPVDLAPTISAFDCLMFVNTDRRQRYIDAGLVADDERRAPLIGYPKVDCLVNGSLDRAAIAHSLRLDPSVPTVIYAPTWSPHSSLNTQGLDLVDGLAAAGIQVIVKLHDRSYDRQDRGSGGVDWAERLRRYDGHALVRIARESNGCPYMAASDAMVSDHSSIAFEYLLLDRPLIVIDRPALINKASINPEKVRRLRAAADVAIDPREVPELVLAALKQPERRSFERRGTAADLFFQPGTATDRALAVLYRLIDLPMPDAAGAATEPGRQLATVG